jgi:hypothetical protein
LKYQQPTHQQEKPARITPSGYFLLSYTASISFRSLGSQDSQASLTC